MACRVMLIDDSETDLLYTRLMLERSGRDYAVQEFDSAIDALRYLREPSSVPPDLILLDLNMPGMSGFEFLQAYESEPGPAGARAAVVVMLTTSPDQRDRERASRHACVRGYVTKPIDPPTAAALIDLLQGARPDA